VIRSRVIVAMLLVSTGAFAAEPDDTHARAAAQFEAARAAFAKREYAAAATAFEVAAALEPHAVSWMDAADAWERAGDYLRAARDYERVLVLEAVEPRYRVDTERRLAAIAPRLATIVIAGPTGVTGRLDDREDVVSPSRIRVWPGSHVVTAGVPPTNITIDVPAGGARTVVLSAAAPPTPTKTSAPSTAPPPTADASADVAPRKRGVPTATWVSFAIGAAATSACLVLNSVMFADKMRFEQSPTADRADAFHRDRALASVAGGVAIASFVAGGVLWLAAPATW